MPIWTEEQQAIFDEIDRGQQHVVVRARAGTGKTTTIIEALNYAQESDILLAAFNKSIADELSRRVDNAAVQVKTLHALGFGLIRKAWPTAKVGEDNERATKLVNRVFGKTIPDGLINTARQLHTKVRELDPYCETPSRVYEIAVQFDLLPDPEWEDRGWTINRLAKGVLEIVQAAKEETSVVDFADMIFLPLVNNWAAPRYSLVMVDEAQDMSKPQLDLAERVLRHGGRMVFVGDDKQAIYGFRGADSGALDRIIDQLQAKELGLKVTFRCPQSVVAEVNQLVPDLYAHPDAKPGTVERVPMVGQPQPGAFVLSRTNAPLVGVCLDLLRQGQPAIVKGKDIGKGLQKLIKKHYHRDVDTFLARIDGWMTDEERRAAKFPLSAKHERLARIYDQAATLAALADDAPSTDVVRDRVDKLFADDAQARAVICSTVHKAKGLESPEVWVLQHTWSRPGGEEDNLRYVAMTRSKDRLLLVHPNHGRRQEHDDVAQQSGVFETGTEDSVLSGGLCEGEPSAVVGGDGE